MSRDPAVRTIASSLPTGDQAGVAMGFPRVTLVTRVGGPPSIG